MDNVTDKTRRLCDTWIHANASVRRLRRELNRAETELLNAQNELGKWLIPEASANKGQWFHIWFGSGVLRARNIGGNNYEVDWFKEPDGKDRLEYGV